MLIMFIFLLLISESFGGVISPKTERPISPSYNNAGIVADYTINFEIATFMPSGSVLHVTFPRGFFQGTLGISICASEDGDGNSLSCTVSGTTVLISIGELTNAPSDNTNTVKIIGVQNPSTEGSTGFFRLETYWGGNLLDRNDRFGYIGLVAAATTLPSVSVSCTSNCIAGGSATYQVSLTPSAVSSQVRLFVTFPSDLTLLNYVPCTSSNLLDLECTLTEGKVLVSFSSTLTSTTITFTEVQNPSQTGTLGNFAVEVFDADVNTLINYNLAISGPTLTAGPISSFTVCPNAADSSCSSDYSHLTVSTSTYSQYYDYEINATTSNLVPLNGAITITFPTGLVPQTDTCQVLSGLESESTAESDQVLCSVDQATRVLTITKFKAFSPGTFSLKVRTLNPQSSGATASFDVNTYQETALTNLIDSGSFTGVTIDSWGPPTAYSLTVTSTDLIFTIQPTTTITAAAGRQIVIEIPSGYDLLGTLTVSYTPYSLTTENLSSDTTWANRVLTVSIGSASDMLSTGSSQLTVTPANGVTVPSTPDTYLFEIYVQRGVTIYQHFLTEVVVAARSFDVTPTISALSVDILKNTVYTITLTTNLSIPVGTISTDLTVAWGEIQLLFPTEDSLNEILWATDLGTGKTTGSSLACKSLSGLVPVTGDEVTCTLETASAVSTSDFAIVKVTNFQALTSGTSVVLHLADIANVEQDGGTDLKDIQIKVYSITQRVRSELNSDSAQVAQNFYDDNDPDLPIQNGRNPILQGGDGNNIATMVPSTVSATAQLEFILYLENALSATDSLIFKLPNALDVSYSAVSCFLAHHSQETCYSYPLAYWVVIPSLSVSLTAHTEYTFTITGLTNPASVQALTSFQIIPVASSRESEYINFNDLENPLPGTIQASVTAESYVAGSIDVMYTWLFTLSNDLAAGSSIILGFPEDSFTLTNTPVLEFQISGALTASGADFTYTIDSSTVTIAGFASHTAGSSIYVQVFHTVNPPEKSISGYFTMESLDASGNAVDANTKITTISYTEPRSVPTLLHQDIYIDPSNGNLPANYLFSVIIPEEMPKESIIKITFPSDFSTIVPTSVSFAGALSTYGSYSVSGSQIDITTDTKLLATETPLNITIGGITNFASSVTSEEFFFEIEYSGVIYMTNPEVQTNRIITTTPTASSLTVTAISHSPKTASEPSVFNFAISLTTAVNSTCSLNIEFPEEFPRDLTDSLSVSSVDFTVSSHSISDRILTIFSTTGFSGDFTLETDSIVTPNYLESIGNFIVYTKCNREVQDYGTHPGLSQLAVITQNMYITAMQSTSLYTRYSSNMTLNLYTTTNLIGTDSDLMYIDFPEDYDLSLISSAITCNSSLTADAGDVCSSSGNRIKLNAYISSQSSVSVNDYSLDIYGLENPTEEGLTSYIAVTIYDSANDQIVARTMPNLNKVLPLAFEEFGTEIQINYGKQWTMTAGTRTDTIYASIDTEAPADLNITATASVTGISISPETIEITLGETSKGFQVLCDSSVSPGTYTIEWVISTNTTDNVYSPIKRSTFVVQDTEKETATVGDYFLIPKGGKTMPIEITLSKAPSSNLTVSLTLLEFSEHIIVSPASLTFDGNSTTLFFQIEANPSFEKEEGNLFLSLSGNDSASYQLTNDLIYFEISAADTSLKPIKSLTPYHIQRTSLTFRAEFDEEVIVYWMLSLNGTRTPSSSEVVSGAISETLFYAPQFGTAYEHTSYLYEWEITGLVAQTPYILYIYYTDKGMNWGSLSSLTVQTKDRYRLATFTLKFMESELTDALKLSIQTGLSEVLKISSDRIDFRTDYTASSYLELANIATYANPEFPGSTSTSGRELQTTEVLADILIYPEPSSSSETTPLTIANTLKDYMSTLSSKLTTLNTSYFVEPTQLIGVAPVFTGEPTITDLMSTSVTFSNLTFNQTAIAYYCIGQFNSSDPVPSSWQVYKGVDSYNLPCLVTGSGLASDNKTSVSGLNSSTSYLAYITGSNTIQEYPDLADTVRNISFVTTGSDSFAAVFLLGYSILTLI